MKPASQYESNLTKAQYDQTMTAAPGGWFCWLDFASNLSNNEEPKTDLKGKKRSKVREDQKKSGPINTESRTAQSSQTQISQTPTESNNCNASDSILKSKDRKILETQPRPAHLPARDNLSEIYTMRHFEQYVANNNRTVPKRSPLGFWEWVAFAVGVLYAVSMLAVTIMAASYPSTQETCLLIRAYLFLFIPIFVSPFFSLFFFYFPFLFCF